jgi:Ser-tRNA(Ala) deacylase AlaX
MIEIGQWTACPPTRQLFHDDPYATEAGATVLVASGAEAVFDQSIFYAESGGQVADQGEVEGHRLVDVQKLGGRPFSLANGDAATVESVFRHVFDKPTDLVAGQRVTMHLDWDRRYRNMQMHTLAHFLFFSTGEALGLATVDDLAPLTVGCRISEATARFDFAAEVPDTGVSLIQERVEDLLATSPEATVEPVEGTHDVFVWRAGDIAIPCGGTHVRHPNEIQGRVTVRRRSKGRGLTRLYVELDRTVG